MIVHGLCAACIIMTIAFCDRILMLHCIQLLSNGSCWLGVITFFRYIRCLCHSSGQANTYFCRCIFCMHARTPHTKQLASGVQEYGTGRYNKKHSTFFATMMRELELNEEPEFYFDLVPWQSLASMNHNFLLTERRRHYLRYAGGLTFFEVRASSACLRAGYLLSMEQAISGCTALHLRSHVQYWLQSYMLSILAACCRYSHLVLSSER